MAAAAVVAAAASAAVTATAEAAGAAAVAVEDSAYLVIELGYKRLAAEEGTSQILVAVVEKY